MLTPKCIAFLDQHLPFWTHLSLQDRELLCHSTSPATLAKGQHLMDDGEQCHGVLVVVKGQLRAFLPSEEGKEITLFRMFPGELCSLSASCALDTITFSIGVEAVEDSEVFLISPTAFRTVMDHSLEGEAFIYKKISQRFSDVIWAMEQILFMSFDRRLAIFLMDEYAKTRSKEIPLTHEEIAKLMGSAREVVSRMMKYFAQEGWVCLRRGKVILLDIPSLRAIAVGSRK